MTVWVLLVIYTSGMPSAGIFTYETKAECLKAAENYKRFHCAQVVLPR